MITKQISFTQMAKKLSNLGGFSSELEQSFLAGAKNLYKDGKRPRFPRRVFHRI